MVEKFSKALFGFCISIFAIITVYTLYLIISANNYSISMSGNIILVVLLNGIALSYYKEKKIILGSLFFVASLIPLASFIGGFLI